MKYSEMLFCLLLLFPVLISNGGKLKDNYDFLLSKHKAGRIEVEMPVDALYTKYDRKLTKLVDLYLEGMFTPALEIYLNEYEKKKPSLVAEIGWRKNWIIRRINVYDERFKTDKGIGVGSMLGDIRKSYKVDWIKPGEGPIFARVKEIGMSFALDIVKVPREWHKTRDPNLIPDSVKVVSILIN